MTDEASNLVLEHLRLIRDDISKLSSRIETLTTEVRAVKGHVAVLVQGDLLSGDRLAQLEVEVDRIKARLSLVD